MFIQPPHLCCIAMFAISTHRTNDMAHSSCQGTRNTCCIRFFSKELTNNLYNFTSILFWVHAESLYTNSSKEFTRSLHEEILKGTHKIFEQGPCQGTRKIPAQDLSERIVCGTRIGSLSKESKELITSKNSQDLTGSLHKKIKRVSYKNPLKEFARSLYKGSLKRIQRISAQGPSRNSQGLIQGPLKGSDYQDLCTS